MNQGAYKASARRQRAWRTMILAPFLGLATTCCAFAAGSATTQPGNDAGSSALMQAILRGDAPLAIRLIHEGADVRRAEGDYAETPLHEAACWRRGMLGVVRELVGRGADVHARTARRATALHEACETGDPAIVEFLLEHGAGVNDRDSQGETPLHLAAGSGRKDRAQDAVEIVELLLARGADPNAADGQGRTPLYFARTSGNSNVVAVLIRKGAKVPK